MDRALLAHIERVLGGSVQQASRVAGGDINDAHRLRLDDGRVVFAKTNERALAGMFQVEALGLQWLAQADALRVPRVLAVSSDDAAPFLVLEYLEPGARQRDFDEQLGRGLAALHRFGAAEFGFNHDNFIGSLPQSNQRAADWASFYRERRLLPQGHKAARHLGSDVLRRLEQLCARLEQLVGPSEPPARLHGDLWGGNLHCDSSGAPCLIDPAVYGGHREMDLAMMRLFGGFGARVFDAYQEAFPVDPGWQERVPLYQLYPLLVHVNLFGGGYVGSVEGALSRYA